MSDDDEALVRDREAWRHFASKGAIDKNTMITTVSWLLGIGAAPIGYIVTQLIESRRPPVLVQPGQMIVISMLGMVISGIAGYVSLLYGGYANRNWAKADRIADTRGWRDLLPETHPNHIVSSAKKNARGLAKYAWNLSRDCDPETALPPVFVVFFILAFLMFVTNAVFLVWAGSVWLLFATAEMNMLFALVSFP